MTKEEKNYIKTQLEQLKIAAMRNHQDALKLIKEIEYWTNIVKRANKNPA